MSKFQTGDLVRMRGNSNNPKMIVTTHTGSTLKEGYYDCSWWDNGYRHQVFVEHELEDADVHPPQTTESSQLVTPKERKYVHILTGEVCEVTESLSNGHLLRCVPLVNPNGTGAVWVDHIHVSNVQAGIVDLLHSKVLLLDSPGLGPQHVQDIRVETETSAGWQRVRVLVTNHGWVDSDKIMRVTPLQ